VFVAVVDCGSFSAAGERLERSQPVVSYMVATLEAQLGFALFERGRRRPVLTERGAALLVQARRVCLLGDEWVASAEALRRGHESEITLAVDPLYPRDRLAAILADFARAHPTVPVTLRTEVLGGVLDVVLARQCQLGISAMVIDWPDTIEPREFGVLDMVPVAAPTHALALREGVAPESEVREHVQLVLRDPGRLTQDVDFAITGLRLWHVTEFDTKLALLRAGIGWGHMPLHLVQRDLEAGTLVKLRMPTRPGGRQGFCVLHRLDSPPGPLGRWILQQLTERG